MPAEWEPQEAIWLSWPVATHIWPGQHEEIEETFARLAALMSHHQKVCINATPAAHPGIREHLNRARADLTVTSLHAHPTNDVWCRDHGPIWLRHDETGEVAITDWAFNAWGGKFSPWDLDNTVPRAIAHSLSFKCFSRPEILEGGAVETDGQGKLLVTEAVLLNPNRGPGLTRASWERPLADTLGIEETLWLGDGLPNDDTDGHIDNIARFFAPDHLLAVEPGPHANLLENLKNLRQRFAHVITLPLPDYRIPGTTEASPASYANYVVLNDAVIVPAYGDSQLDDTACGIIGDCFPGRRIHPFDSRLLIEEGGSVHCLSTNQPGH